MKTQIPANRLRSTGTCGLIAIACSLGMLQRAAGADTATPASATPPAGENSMQWFLDAKLGIFIHWGIYSEGKNSESWAFHDGKMPHDEYYAQARTFTAAAYNPDRWAELFQEAGAKYVVLTSKHHDGFALWDTRFSKLNAKDGSPAGRDLLGPYCDALRHHGLKVGLYFSHLDWGHPDYPSILPPKARGSSDPQYKNVYSYPQGPEKPEAWERFLSFHRGQLEELSTRFKPDLFWFDGDWERTPGQWHFKELRDQLKTWNPNVILNSRMGPYGDYGTPEQFMPLVPPTGAWELCMTINDSWGYQESDRNYKSVRQVVRLLAECAGMGGNLLLDIGPRSDGTLQPEQEAVLRGLGRWTHKQAEALYGSVAGLPAGYFYGASTLNKKRDTLYLFFFDKPIDSLALKGVRNKIKRISVLGGAELNYKTIGGASWVNMPGITWIDVPEKYVDPDATVIKVELEGSLDLATTPKVEGP